MLTCKNRASRKRNVVLCKTKKLQQWRKPFLIFFFLSFESLNSKKEGVIVYGGSVPPLVRVFISAIASCDIFIGGNRSPIVFSHTATPSPSPFLIVRYVRDRTCSTRKCSCSVGFTNNRVLVHALFFYYYYYFCFFCLQGR